jgi:hypothetical protein
MKPIGEALQRKERKWGPVKTAKNTFSRHRKRACKEKNGQNSIMTSVDEGMACQGCGTHASEPFRATISPHPHATKHHIAILTKTNDFAMFWRVYGDSRGDFWMPYLLWLFGADVDRRHIYPTKRVFVHEVPSGALKLNTLQGFRTGDITGCV